MDQWELLLLPLLSALAGLIIAVLLLRITIRRLSNSRFTSQLAKFLSDIPGVREHMQERLSDPAVFQASVPLISHHIDDFFRRKLPKAMPFISHFIGDKTIESLKSLFMQEVEELFPQMMKQFAAHGQNTGVTAVVADQLAASLRTRLKHTLLPELRKLLLVAALAGFVFGLFEAALLYLLR
ncbi:MAG TPA: hypothetical protein VEB63_06970 [Chitinophagaceae bacterium]|nr:hypothetical protein [Chitinophagaceae bacterium]